MLLNFNVPQNAVGIHTLVYTTVILWFSKLVTVSSQKFNRTWGTPSLHLQEMAQSNTPPQIFYGCRRTIKGNAIEKECGLTAPLIQHC